MWAVLSDIHGNWRALEAVVADLSFRDITRIVNLGDCAYGPFDPRQVLDWMMTNDVVLVSGNEDRVLVDASRGESCSRTALVCAEYLDPKQWEWLETLPLTWSDTRLLAFHGTPGDDSHYLLTEVDSTGAHPRAEQEIRALLVGAQERIVLCGHDHTARGRSEWSATG